MNIHRRQEHTDRYFLGKADFFRKPLLVDTWSWFINQVGFLSGGALCKQSCCVLLQQLPRVGIGADIKNGQEHDKREELKTI